MMLKKFSVIIEVELDQKKYDEVESWGVAPSDYIASIISDHERDRGLILKTSVTEIEHSLYKRLCVASDDFIGKDAIADIEEAVLKNKMCIGGNCED